MLHKWYFNTREEAEEFAKRHLTGVKRMEIHKINKQWKLIILA